MLATWLIAIGVAIVVGIVVGLVVSISELKWVLVVVPAVGTVITVFTAFLIGDGTIFLPFVTFLVYAVLAVLAFLHMERYINNGPS